MDGIRFDVKTDRGIRSGIIGGFNHPLEALHVHNDFIIISLEGHSRNFSAQHAAFLWYNVDVLRSNDNVHFFTGSKAAVYAFKGVTRKRCLPVAGHRAVQYIGFTDEVSHKGVFRFIVDIHR